MIMPSTCRPSVFIPSMGSVVERVKCSTAGAGTIRRHRPLLVWVQILQIFIFVGFLQGGVTGSGTEGLTACWRGGAACLPAVLS